MSRRQLAAVTAGYAALAVIVMRDVWFAASPSVVGAPLLGPYPNGDSIQLVWFLRWTPFALQHGMNPLLTTYLDSPHGANLMWNSLLPLPGIVLSPITLLGGSVAAANVLATLGLIACGVAACACAVRFAGSLAAALLAGALYEVSAFVLGELQAAHAGIVLGAAFMPVVLLLVIDVARRERSLRGGGIALGLVAAAMYYTWAESLLIAAVFGAIGVLMAAAVATPTVRRVAAYSAGALAIAAVIALILAAPGLLVQFLGPNRLHGLLRPTNVNVIDLLNAITPTSAQAIAPGGTQSALGRGAYLGVPLLVIAVPTAVLQWRRPWVRWLTVMMLAGFVCSLGPSLHVGGRNTGIPLPWAVAAHLPLLQDVPASRLAVVPVLAASLLAGVWMAWLLRGERRIVAALGAVLLAASWLPAAVPADPLTTPRFFTGPEVRAVPEGSVALIAPWVSPWEPQAQLWQAQSGMRFRMPEGYVLIPGRGGSGLSQYPAPSALSTAMETVAAGGMPSSAPVMRTAFLTDLRAWEVHTVIVGGMEHRAAMVAFFTALLDRAPQETAGVAVWRDVGAAP